MSEPTDHHKALLDWFRSWPWPQHSGDTLSDDDCGAIKAVILERDALTIRLADAEAMAEAMVSIINDMNVTTPLGHALAENLITGTAFDELTEAHAEQIAALRRLPDVLAKWRAGK